MRKPKLETINIILMDGGLGDHISSLIAVNYIIEKYPWITPLVYTPDYLKDLSTHLLPDKTYIRNYTEMQQYYSPNRPTKTTRWDGVVSPMKIHCADYAFLKLCDEMPAEEFKKPLKIKPDLIKIDKFNLPKDYAVLTVGHTVKVREWPANEVNKVAKYLINLGTTPIFLGSTSAKTGTEHVIKGQFSEDIDYSLGIDLIDKTNLLEAAKIMHGARAVLGVDNGLLHLATCTDAPIVGGFTTVSPGIRVPYSNDQIYLTVTPDVKCRFCQKDTNFLYGHVYTECLYKRHESGYLGCTKEMTGEKFIDKLKGLL